MLKFFLIIALYIPIVCFGISQEKEVLPSWNEGEAKNAILKFVAAVTQKDSPQFVRIEDRIATLDEDGTLWVEQPMYTQLFFAIDRVRAKAAEHPEWKTKEPFASILKGDLEALRKMTLSEIEEIVAVTHAGMSVETFHQEVSNWLDKAVHPRFNKRFTELIYQPMLELIHYLRDNDFDVYIVSGGGQEFIRAFAQRVYNIAPSHVIGTAGKVKYEYQEGNPILLKLPEILFVNDKQGKPEGINLIIGKRPLAAFGNSVGDQQMLEWTQGGSGKRFELLVHHDDAEREYAYGPESKIGTFSDALMKEALDKGWVIVSIKNDWKKVFP